MLAHDTYVSTSSLFPPRRYVAELQMRYRGFFPIEVTLVSAGDIATPCNAQPSFLYRQNAATRSRERTISNSDYTVHVTVWP